MIVYFSYNLARVAQVYVAGRVGDTFDYARTLSIIEYGLFGLRGCPTSHSFLQIMIAKAKQSS